MKKILLTIMLSAAAFGAGAAVPMFPEASPQTPLTITASTLQGGQQQDIVAMSDAATTDLTQPVKMPATAMKTPVRKAAEHQWGEWYTFKTGTLSSDYPYAYSSVFNIELPVEVKLLRRDATDDASTSQLRFEGFLDDSGIVYNWDNASGLILWDPVDIAGFENTHEAGTPITFKQLMGSYYYPKTELKLNAFINVMSNQMGFYGVLTFTPDDLPDCAIDFTLTATDAEAGEVAVSFNTVGSDITEIRYGLIYANSINYAAPEYSRVYAYGTLFDIKTVVKNNFSDFDITSLPGEGGVTRKHTVDRSGRWAVGVLLFDKEEDILGFYVKDIRIGLSEAEKWEDAGMATFTDSNFSQRFESARRELGVGLYTSITFPEWADASLTWEVPLQKSKETPGLYRLVNPYTCEASPCSDAVMHFETATESYDRTISFDKSHDYYYIFDIQNPDRPWAYMTPTGVWFNYGEDLLPGMDSVNQNRTPENYDFGELRYEEGGRISTGYNNFEILLPGYNDYNVTFGTTTKEVYIESMGGNVAKVKYSVLPSSVDNQNIYARIAADDEELAIATATQPGVLDLSAFGVEPEADFYTIYAVTYDAGGAAHVNKKHTFMLYKHEYKFYSRAQLREVILEERLGYPSEFYDVEVYTADDAEGHYFIRDPYYSNPWLWNSISLTGTYMDIDCSDPDHVNLPEYTIPADLGYGKMTVQSLSNYYMTVGGYSFEEVAEAGWFGYYRNGMIKLPFIGGVLHLEQGDRYMQSCALTTFCLRFPGYVDYSFELENSDSKILVNKVENGVSHIKFSVAEVGTISHSDLMATMQSGEAEMYDLDESHEIDLRTLGFAPFKRYLIVAASFDADGILREFKYMEYLLETEYKYAGQGTYTDAILQLAFGYDAVQDIIDPREVEVYTCDEEPGRVFVKNPFSYVVTGSYPYCTSAYMPFDVTDPQRVYIPANRMGIGSGTKYFFYSKAEDYRRQGTADADIPADAFGTLAEGRIEIPVESLVGRRSDGAVIWDNEATVAVPIRAMVLELPESLAGVEEVSVEPVDAPAEYFDLQGRRVQNPAAGFYIERRGAAVKKVFIR